MPFLVLQHPERHERVMELLPADYVDVISMDHADQVILDGAANWPEDRRIVAEMVEAWHRRLPIYHFQWPGGTLMPMQLDVTVVPMYGAVPHNV